VIGSNKQFMVMVGVESDVEVLSLMLQNCIYGLACPMLFLI